MGRVETAIDNGRLEVTWPKCLLVMDMQSAMFELPRPLHEAEELLEKVARLTERARASENPVVYVQHAGGDDSPFRPGSHGWQIHPAVAPRPGELVVEKTHCDAFQGGRLMAELDRLEIRHIVVCGLVTEGCVDTTVRRAFGLGLSVELASDCHSTTDGPVLTADLTKQHHNEVLKPFARVRPASDVSFEHPVG